MMLSKQQKSIFWIDFKSKRQFLIQFCFCYQVRISGLSHDLVDNASQR
jgi:hypothetical protein